MTPRKYIHLFGFLILLLSLVLLLWSFWPLESSVRSLPIFPEDMQLPDLSVIPAMTGLFLRGIS